MSELVPSKARLCIIGGGIYGSALLWEAAHRGIHAVMFEQNDFGSGTSANSLKTIHGGFRYLQNLQINRTVQSHREKLILSTIAPELIKPLSCAIAADSSIKNNSLVYRLAALFMNALTGLTSSSERAMAAAFMPVRVEKGRSIWNGSGDERRTWMLWDDAQCVNTERLAIAFIQAARSWGATATNYTRVAELTRSGEGDFRVRIEGKHRPEQWIDCQWVVDCTGEGQFYRASKAFHQRDSNAAPEYVGAMNLVLDGTFSEFAVALPSKLQTSNKQGMLFLSPWQGCTLAGTWYYPAGKIASKQGVDASLVNQCLSDVSEALKGEGLNVSLNDLKAKLLDIHWGELPAKSGSENPESRLLSDSEIRQIDPGFWLVQGTKYTTARLSAVEMIDKLAAQDSTITRSRSHQLNLAEQYAKRTGLDAKLAVNADIVSRYGALAQDMRAIGESDLIPGRHHLFRSEVAFLTEHEHVEQLADLILRRLNINTSKPFEGAELATIAEIWRSVMGISEAECQRQLDAFKSYQSWQQSLSEG